MTTNDNEIPPKRGVQHDALALFLGRWRAEGQSYGSPNQPDDDPKSAPSRGSAPALAHGIAASSS